MAAAVPAAPGRAPAAAGAPAGSPVILPHFGPVAILGASSILHQVQVIADKTFCELTVF